MEIVLLIQYITQSKVLCNIQGIMQHYESSEGKTSGVTGFELGRDFIIVEFNHEVLYKYSYKSCGAAHVHNMSGLAVRRKGLSTYISRNHPEYEYKQSIGYNRSA